MTDLHVLVERLEPGERLLINSDGKVKKLSAPTLDTPRRIALVLAAGTVLGLGSLMAYERIYKSGFFDGRDMGTAIGCINTRVRENKEVLPQEKYKVTLDEKDYCVVELNR